MSRACAAPISTSVIGPYVREANEGTTSWITRVRVLGSKWDRILLGVRVRVRLSSQQDCISLALRAPLRDAPLRDVCERGDLSEFLAARTCASCWLDKGLEGSY